MILILAIFLTIIGILLYIYLGLHISEDIIDPYGYVLFWVAYIFFGISMGTILMLGKFWSVLITKTGPPGLRGIPGAQGDSGISGECNDDHNVLYAMKTIKETINQVALDTGIITSNNKNDKSVYNPDTLTLTNSYIDFAVKRMVTSKQFEILLSLPSDNLAKLPPGSRMTFAKSLDDLTGYLSGIWSEWITDIIKINKSAASAFLTSIDGQTEDNPEIEAYFRNEIEKYDVWYWGATRVFRPLKAEVCRQSVLLDNKGNEYANVRFPGNLKPRIEIREITYSDKDTSKLIETWRLDSMPDATPNFTAWKSRKSGIWGDIGKPLAMIPKIIKEGDKTFYPIGQVFVEGNSKRKTDTIKKTILVSGDVIIPDIYDEMWYDRKGTNILKKGGMGKSDGDSKGRFWKLGSSQPGYTCLGDYFMSDWRARADIEKKFGIKNPDKKDMNRSLFAGYTGIVCVPSDCLIELPRAENPKFSYQFSGDYYKNAYYQVDVFTAKDSQTGYNIIRSANPGYKALATRKYVVTPKDGKFYKFADKCIKPPIPDVKTPMKEFTDLGIGWFGHPMQTNQKYSVFAYLGIMPEGIIIHRNSGHRHYIRHYGGMEPNKFIVLQYDPDQDKDFTNAYRVSSDSSVGIAAVNLTDERQQWRINNLSDGNFRLASVVYPTKYLKMDYMLNPATNKYGKGENMDLQDKRPPGITTDQAQCLATLTSGVVTPDLTANNKTLFINLPAFGVDTDILEEASARPIDRRKSIKDQEIDKRKLEGQVNYDYIMKNDDVDKNKIGDINVYPGNVIRYTTTRRGEIK